MALASGHLSMEVSRRKSRYTPSLNMDAAPIMLRIRCLAFAVLFSLAAVAMAQGEAKAVPAGQACETGTPCDKGLWCEPSVGKCATQAGVCVTIPRLCIARKKSASFQPVCGCNSKTYSNDCFRRAYRIGKSHDGKC
jgi:hypothetical protein